MRIYLTGHRSFDNKGCEAIVRSTVEVIRDLDQSVTFLVPSLNAERDLAQWPSAPSSGVVFVQAPKLFWQRVWVNLQRLPISVLKRMVYPFRFSRQIVSDLKSVDLVLSIGGDNYSLDYKIPAPQVAIDNLAFKLGKPVILWGASVGPFDKEPSFARFIKSHLSRMEKIVVRESISEKYLRQDLELSNIVLGCDPAFFLKPEPLDRLSFLPHESSLGTIGINISPTLGSATRDRDQLVDDVEIFARRRIMEGFSILFLHHVTSTAMGEVDDVLYMKKLRERLAEFSGKVGFSPPTLNAAQVKSTMSRLRFFLGARTHATIAALSCGIPTISLAYSVKAYGINNDLFGHLDAVLPAPEITTETLEIAMAYLRSSEGDMKRALRAQFPLLEEAMGRGISVVNETFKNIDSRE